MRFHGTGVGKPRKLPIPGADYEAVRQAIWFLRRVSLYNSGLITRDEVPIRQSDRVFVIGCGNTAIDAARTALRLEARGDNHLPPYNRANECFEGRI